MSKKKDISHRHHYIPVFYLKGFLKEGNNRLNIFDKTSGDSFKNIPENVAYKKDLYKIEINGTEEDAQEKAFARFEGLIPPIISEINDTKKLPRGKNFNLLIEFIALMHCRTPKIIKHDIEPNKELFRMITDLLLSREEIYTTITNRMKEEGITLSEKSSYEEIKEFWDSGKWTIDVGQNENVKTIFRRLNNILPFLHERKWSLYISDDTHGGFICSDNPVSLISLDKLPQICSPGIAMLRTDLTIPLSKNIALVGRFEGEEKIYTSTPFFTAGINSRTAISADRFLFSSSDEFIIINQNGVIATQKDVSREIKKTKGIL
jgi:hypothetical protein